MSKPLFTVLRVIEDRIYIDRSYASQSPIEKRCATLGLRLCVYGHEVDGTKAYPYIIVERDGVRVNADNWKTMLYAE